MSEAEKESLRQALREPIITVPPPKIQAVMGLCWRNTLILHDNEIEEIVRRVSESVSTQ